MTEYGLIIFNLFVFLITLWIFMVIYNRYFLPAKFDKHRFKLFELRDRLALMAMKKSIDIKSEEYIYLISLINVSITVFEDFRIVDSILNFVKYNSNLAKSKKILNKIHNHSCELKDIAYEFYETLGKMLYFKTAILYFFVFMLYEIVKIMRISLNIVNKINKAKTFLKTTLCELRNNKKILAT